MAECPFCRSEVPEDLVTFGGPCPKCFADIPGEEAATDPGEEVKAAQARQDQVRSTLRTVLPFLLILPIVGALALAALWFGVLRPAPEVVLLDFDDDLEEYPMPELVGAAPEPVDDGAADAAPATGSGTGSTPAPAPAAAAPQPEPKPSPGGLDLSLDVNTSRRGTVLDDPDAIKKMIGQRMAAQAPRLNSCYEKELKNDENLAGRWRIAFVVGTDGKATGAKAEPLSMGVSSFEACLAEEIGRWSFQRINRAQPVRKTFTFRPAP